MTKNRNNKPIEPCKKCGANNFNVGRFVASSGTMQFPWYCVKCKHKTNLLVKKEVIEKNLKIKSKKINDFYYLGASELKNCDVCGVIGAELHHYAPRHIGGDDCDKWTTGYLCTKHHKEWHEMIQTHRKYAIK